MKVTAKNEFFLDRYRIDTIIQWGYPRKTYGFECGKGIPFYDEELPLPSGEQRLSADMDNFLVQDGSLR